MNKRRIAILGAGFTGLSAALKFSENKNFEVDLIEKEEKAGGLAVGFKKNNWNWTIENAYHHIFTSDVYCRLLCKELGINLIYKRPVTTTYYNKGIYQLDSPFSLLTFPYLNLDEKIRTGLVLAFLKFNPSLITLEKYTAKEWLIKYQGQRPWKILWEPLFVGKFGKFADSVSMSWFWARIFKRSSSLGYPEGGFQNIADKLDEKINKLGGKTFYNCEVIKANYSASNNWQLSIKSLNTKYKIRNTRYDYIISTIPMPQYLKLFPTLPEKYKKKLSEIHHLHALNLILELKKPFLNQLKNGTIPYWININDTSFPFLAVVEHTNFMDRKNYGNHTLLYIGNYLPYPHPYFQMEKNKLLDLFIPFLKKINQNYDVKDNLIDTFLFPGPFAQPVMTINYSKILPSLRSPLPNLFVGNLDNVYPWDRGTNYAIELGQKLFEAVQISNKAL